MIRFDVIDPPPETIVIDREKLAEFLAINSDRVFYARSPCGCPLAEFMNDCEPREPQVRAQCKWWVTSDQIRRVPKSSRIPMTCWPLPPWVKTFTNRVDRLGPDNTGAPSRPILGRDALHCLLRV